MRLYRSIILLIIMLSVYFLSSGMANSKPIKAVTATLPPFTVSPEERGISHDLVNEISKRSGVEIEIEYLPWSRAQVVVDRTPNTLIFSIGRIEYREPKYKWITELFKSNTVFVTLGDKIDSFEQAKGLSVISVLANTPREKKLIEEDLTNYLRQYRVELCARVLNGGRVDAWYTLDVRSKYVFEKEGFDASKLVLGEPTDVLSLWLASNLEFDDSIAQKLNAAMESIKADGTFDQIIDRYL